MKLENVYNSSVVMISLPAIVVSLLVLSAGNADAPAQKQPEVVVEWKDVRSYADIRAGRGNQLRYEQRVFKELGNHIKTESAKLLKEGQQLLVTVHNLDLAGEIRMNAMGPGENMRVVREPTLTMIDLEYKLLDASNKVLISGRDKMRGNRSYRFGSHAMHNRSFNYEKQMISDWLNLKLKPKIIVPGN
jgi:hypothetical protein